MFGWWLGLPAWLRMVLGLVVLLIGGGIVLAGLTGHIIEGQRVFPRFSLILIGLGFAMIVFGGKSDSERGGYHF